mmetsp:Transcript_3751/g.8468  ORF Transcript_3751/g.8468 Transcript_3751/m.8468 type:complete len:204 (+) Transcript_3751:2-613(+)
MCERRSRYGSRAGRALARPPCERAGSDRRSRSPPLRSPRPTGSLCPAPCPGRCRLSDSPQCGGCAPPRPPCGAAAGAWPTPSARQPVTHLPPARPESTTPTYTAPAFPTEVAAKTLLRGPLHSTQAPKPTQPMHAWAPEPTSGAYLSRPCQPPLRRACGAAGPAGRVGRRGGLAGARPDRVDAVSPGGPADAAPRALGGTLPL